MKEKAYEAIMAALAEAVDPSVLEDRWVCEQAEQLAEQAVWSFEGQPEDEEQIEELCEDMDNYAKED